MLKMLAVTLTAYALTFSATTVWATYGPAPIRHSTPQAQIVYDHDAIVPYRAALRRLVGRQVTAAGLTGRWTVLRVSQTQIYLRSVFAPERPQQTDTSVPLGTTLDAL